MKHSVLTPEASVIELAKRTYTAGELIAATGVTQNILTNYLTKANITLCSKPGGRGNPRRFELLDIYAISIMHGLVNLTGNQQWSARAVELLLFAIADPFAWPINELRIAEREEFPKRRQEIMTDIRCARPVFYDRKWHTVAWIIFAEKTNVVCNTTGFKLYCVGDQRSTANDDRFLVSADEGYHMNLTWRLYQLDQRLIKIVEG